MAVDRGIFDTGNSAAKRDWTDSHLIQNVYRPATHQSVLLRLDSDSYQKLSDWLT